MSNHKLLWAHLQELPICLEILSLTGNDYVTTLNRLYYNIHLYHLSLEIRYRHSYLIKWIENLKVSNTTKG